MNRRKLLSLLLSLMIHSLVFLALFLLLRHTPKVMTSSGAKRVELSLKDFVTTPHGIPRRSQAKPTPPTPKPTPSVQKPNPSPLKPQPKPQRKTSEATQSPPKPKPVKKIVRKTTKTKRKTSSHRSPLLKRAKRIPNPHPKPIKKPKTTPLPVRRPLPPPSPQSALAGALGSPAIPRRPVRPTSPPPSIDQINGAMGEREFRALYKDEFDHFSPQQKRFIRSNLNRIQAITQHYLTMRGYPPFAVQQRMQGVNIVEFYLWPNGDITDLKVIASSGFDVLDDNSLDTIKAAYKDYPRPKEKTKIRFYIRYSIY